MDRLPEPCPWARRARRARLVPRSPGAAGSGVVQAYRHAGGRPTEPARSPGRPRHATGAGRFAVDSRAPCRCGTPPCAGNPGLRLIYIGGAGQSAAVRPFDRAPADGLDPVLPPDTGARDRPVPLGLPPHPGIHIAHVDDVRSRTGLAAASTLAAREPPVAPPRRAGTLLNPSGRNDCS